MNRTFKIFIDDVRGCYARDIDPNTRSKIMYMLKLEKKFKSTFFVMEETSELQRYLTYEEINVLRKGGKIGADGNFILTTANLLNLYQNNGTPETLMDVLGEMLKVNTNFKMVAHG